MRQPIRRTWLVALCAACGCPATGTTPGDGGREDGRSEYADGEDIPGTDGDADGDGCTGGPELCNGIDDDCDRMTDEDFDLSLDANNCGECGAVCSPANASGACTDGSCRIVSCAVGWVDANGAAVDGCEYLCTPSGTESTTDGTCSDGLDNDCDGRTDNTDGDCSSCVPELCNRLDDDCDGITDEGFDTDFDPLNCAGCGRSCARLAHAVPRCILGTCEYECEPGWSDLDRLRWNGCEATCAPTGDTTELACNGVDNDCDGLTDEDFAPTLCGEGACRRQSYCFHGTEDCEPRDPPATTDATCDRIDDDCDGATDEEASCICYSDDECNDGNPCSGIETCTPGVECRAGTPTNCDDGIPCTNDYCNPMDGGCLHEPSSSVCDDRDPCNGVETCVVGEGCVNGTPVDCDDDIPCTTDTCDAADGTCRHAPGDSICQDGVFCNGSEICDLARGCIAGAPPSCGDGLLCTADSCSASADSCVNTPMDARCDDGQFCNGAERCAPGSGCESGIAPRCDDTLSCTTDTCDPAAGGGAGQCVYTPPDGDRDGFPPLTCLGTDCNDGNANIHPGASERCNAIDDDCDDSTDEAYECIQGAPGSCTVGACSGVRTCSSSCLWGTCSVLASEVCNGIDDNCNGSADETFTCRRDITRSCTVPVATKTCTGTQTCIGPSCTWGTCVIAETGGNIETCDGIDNDCDTTVDDPPTAPAVLCAAVDHATVACTAGACRISSCSSGWADTDTTYSTGCECSIESPEAGGTCAAPRALTPAFTDVPTTDQTITARLTSDSDIDCYSFTATDSTDVNLACDPFNVDIRFTPTGNPSSQFQMSVWRGGCATAACTGELANYNWHVDSTVCLNATGLAPCGECSCTTVEQAGYNTCSNNGGTYTFCVSRRSGFTPNCDSYSIRVTNGVY